MIFYRSRHKRLLRSD